MTLPTRNLELLQFCEMRAPIWSSAAPGIGLSAAQALAFANATAQARDKYDGHQAAIEASRGAGVTAREHMAALRRTGGDTIRLIRAFAEQSPDPAAVYQTAQIPPPSVPAPLPPPGQPTDFRALLNPSGAITLRWRCNNPGGQTVYLVKRKLAGQTQFSFLGAAGEREFTDATVPSGSTTITYMITAQRGTVFGADSLPFQIMFGVAGAGGGGAGEFSILSQGPVMEDDGQAKMAA